MDFPRFPTLANIHSYSIDLTYLTDISYQDMNID